MDWTDRHCRFHRQLTRRAVLYTVMVVTRRVIRARDRLLGFDDTEHRLPFISAVRIRGSSPRRP
nr:hypothetical protein [Mesorhizobium sp.]